MGRKPQWPSASVPERNQPFALHLSRLLSDASLDSFQSTSPQDSEKFSKRNRRSCCQLWPGAAIELYGPAQQMPATFRDPPAPCARDLRHQLPHV